MVSNVSESGSPNPIDPHQQKAPSISDNIPDSITKQYPVQPGFKKMMQIWFKNGHVDDKMVSMFEKNVLSMIQDQLKQAKKQHQKIVQEIKRRIKENG